MKPTTARRSPARERARFIDDRSSFEEPQPRASRPLMAAANKLTAAARNDPAPRPAASLRTPLTSDLERVASALLFAFVMSKPLAKPAVLLLLATIVACV